MCCPVFSVLTVRFVSPPPLPPSLSCRYIANGCAASATNYLCSTNDKGGRGTDPGDTIPAAPPGSGGGKVGGAVEGTYVITYHASAQGGVLHECSAPKRTVIVKPKGTGTTLRRLRSRDTASAAAVTHVAAPARGARGGARDSGMVLGAGVVLCVVLFLAVVVVVVVQSPK